MGLRGVPPGATIHGGRRCRRRARTHLRTTHVPALSALRPAGAPGRAAMAALGAYELGNVRYGERDWARARSAYEIAAARTGSPTLKALARAGIGYTWEAERNPAKAVESYHAALAGLKPGDFYYEDLLLDLARSQEQAGKKDAAVETYRRHLKELPRSPRADEIKGRLTRLGASP